jgi:hypothetical protein
MLVSACQNVPRYKNSNGEFDEWGSYEGKNFSPSNGTVTAVDLAAQSISIAKGKSSQVYLVTPTTRLMHEGTDITLDQVPINHAVKYTLAKDHLHLLTVWYGIHTNVSARAAHVARKK